MYMYRSGSVKGKQDFFCWQLKVSVKSTGIPASATLKLHKVSDDMAFEGLNC